MIQREKKREVILEEERHDYSISILELLKEKAVEERAIKTGFGQIRNASCLMTAQSR